jgi:hypothetical protein
LQVPRHAFSDARRRAGANQASAVAQTQNLK